MKVLCVAVLLLPSFVAFAQPSVYRAPKTVSRLPEPIRNVLEQQGCLIPVGILDHTNVIKGSFAKQGQIDWAVLCSISGKSHIQVFWGGSASCPSQTAPRSDAGDLYQDSNGKTEYYRGLGVVGKEYILSHHAAYDGPMPPSVTHEGINDMYLEKASIVYFCYQGSWQQLTGAD